VLTSRLDRTATRRARRTGARARRTSTHTDRGGRAEDAARSENGRHVPGAGRILGNVSPLDSDVCYRALIARDARFDGLFFVGVKTTGIYCRPVCRARTPGRARCLFFRTAAQAEEAGFRSCFRCRPELAPGAAPVDAVSRVVATAMRRIEEGVLSPEGSVDALARELGISGRHLRRAMQAELGVSPLALAASRRLALARQLIVDTALPMTEVAFASGFRSVRRFNAAVKARYGRSPSTMRRVVRDDGAAGGESFAVTLPYRPPYDWPAILAHLAARAIAGVELVRDGVYLRTAAVGAQRGWLAVAADPDRPALRATISTSLLGGLMTVVARLRRLFDLDAEPGAIAAHLARDPRLAAHVRARPGLRVAGAFEPFEAAARAVLGQQVSLAAARTIEGRLAARLGETVATPHPDLDRVLPSAESLARRSTSELAALLGVPSRRAATLAAIARAIARGELALDAGEPTRLVEQIIALPGVGPWTAHYLAMRALGWPDAFPEGDLVLRQALGGISGREARALAERWRPWRAYGATHLWTELGTRRAAARAHRLEHAHQLEGAQP
jgi:AraC family transcriptional regulator, regulatory protein of adaptative response / DNA-3-methyladenine glycosylase II